jgi:hypothetical protein
MWLPQFHAHRFERDMNLAESYGCQGLLAIHWRHRIVDPTAGFQARFSWDSSLVPAGYYRAWARTQAAGARAAPLAETMTDTDRDRKLPSTFTGEIKDGHVVTHAFSGDYHEAFTFWNDYQPEAAVMESGRQVASTLRTLAGDAGSAAERERLEYLMRHVEFLVPYAEAWIAAHGLHQVLKAAAERKKAGKVSEAADKVRVEGVPLWMRLAPEVRRAVLDFQRIVCTRNWARWHRCTTSSCAWRWFACGSRCARTWAACPMPPRACWHRSPAPIRMRRHGFSCRPGPACW